LIYSQSISPQLVRLGQGHLSESFSVAPSQHIPRIYPHISRIDPYPLIPKDPPHLATPHVFASLWSLVRLPHAKLVAHVLEPDAPPFGDQGEQAQADVLDLIVAVQEGDVALDDGLGVVVSVAVAVGACRVLVKGLPGCAGHGFVGGWMLVRRRVDGAVCNDVGSNVRGDLARVAAGESFERRLERAERDRTQVNSRAMAERTHRRRRLT
jgi:hypothetical protein